MYKVLRKVLVWFSALLFIDKLYKWIYILIKTLPRDFRLLKILLKISLFTKKYTKQNATVATVFSNYVKRHPTKVAFYFEDEAWTFEKVEEFSNKIASYFKQQGYQKGDVVALLLENCIEYAPIWLGLSKAGIVTALININVVQDPLIHSLEVAQSKALIFGTSNISAVQEVLEKLRSIKLYHFSSNENEECEKSMGFVNLYQELKGVSHKFETQKDQSITDQLMYIYTSGTTGFPKAATVTHQKFILCARAFNQMMLMTKDDVCYTVLPLYHSAGGIGGAGQPLISGNTLALRKKFSARNFFKDCTKYNVTVTQYIGELCRYLLAAPVSEYDKYHLKAMIGNGFKPQIWKQFRKRYENVETIIEIYGSTEGTAFLGNFDGTVGAVGFIPRYARRLLGLTTIKCDIDGEIIRNKDGFCIECGVGELGIMISKMDQKNAMLKYDGYTDKLSSNKKILTNVFSKGDSYYNSNDILEYDELGYYYFRDRTGDTFRWKGENVSTSEVEAVISNVVNFTDVVVYGVQVPYSDGRAGMATILDADKNLQITAIGNSLKRNLAKYAIPIFIRLKDSIALTGTFKLKKTELREEGFNIEKIQDRLYFYHPKLENYVSLTKGLYEEINQGALKF